MKAAAVKECAMIHQAPWLGAVVVEYLLHTQFQHTSTVVSAIADADQL